MNDLDNEIKIKNILTGMINTLTREMRNTNIKLMI